MSNTTVNLETAQEIRTKIYFATINQKCDRKLIVRDIMRKYFPNVAYQFVGEVPAKGANASLMNMKDRYRINYRCGYSRNNYAPCIEILK
jgi:hypothetical protein